MHYQLKVWDPLVRLFHWGLVLSFATAWLSADYSKPLHHWSGYLAAALIAIRIIWGLSGTRYARFSQFIRSPRAILAYIGDIIAGRERRYLGHNPAGGAMVVILLLAVSAQVTLGWLATTDAFFGVEWVETGHGLLAKAILLLISAHILGVIVASWRHRENLPLAMITGEKRAPDADDIA